MTLLRVTFAVIAALPAATAWAAAGELLPPDRPIEEVVNHYVRAKLQQAGVKSAGQADDANLVRRLTLDLAGRIPTAAEARAFVESGDPDKRVKLVDRLLASPAFVRHQATELDAMLMEGTRGSLRGYLLKAVAENRPWDQVFRELLLPDDRDPKRQEAGEFIKQRVRDLDKLTTQVSSLFFGVNVSCAQCHDHPLVHDWKQDHYYGMKSFFGRTFDNGGFVAERGYGTIKFKTRDGKDRQARLMFLTGKVVEEPEAKQPSNVEQQQEKRQLDEYRRKRMAPPPPKFSVRAQLVDVALQAGQRDFFARAIVNRVWHRLFGRGLVMPIDQMHSENPPSHPELLAWLARDLADHQYDLRRLVRGLVLSRAYARASRWEGGAAPKPELFAVARLRPLSPMQLATSLWLATSDPATLPADIKPDVFEKRLEGLEGRARDFARLIEQPRDDFQIGVGEALLFSNGERFTREFLADGGDRLVGRLKQLKDPQALIETAVRNVLSRPPSAEESKLLGDYLARRADRHVEACRQLVWALVTSSEFRFNY
jgi:hypothetical protein